MFLLFRYSLFRSPLYIQFVYDALLCSITASKFFFVFQNVLPDPSTSCGPYKPMNLIDLFSQNSINFVDENSIKFGGEGNHDTIGMVAIDSQGNVASGTSTNGASFKISG